REGDADGKVLRRYVHLSTGNYHPATARQYTDFGLMTANEDLCADVNEVFKQLTGLGRAGKMKHVWQSPFTLHRNIIAAIRCQAWEMAADGSYEQLKPRRRRRSAQEELLFTLATPT